MEGVINIDINETKNEDNINYEKIINEELISNFYSFINSSLEQDRPILIKNKKIFLYFIRKYKYSRNINFLFNQKKKFNFDSSLNKKVLNCLYSYCLFYLFIYYELIKQKKIEDKNIFSMDKYFKLIIKLFKSNLLDIKYIVNIFKFYLFQFKPNSKTNLSDVLSSFFKYFYKFLKEINIQNNNNEVNKLIKKEILLNVFETLNEDQKNDIQINNSNLYLIHSLRKDENIFLLVKLLSENKFISEENKAYIEFNIIKFLRNNFRKEHLNYFYNITKKILIKFNNLNKRAIKSSKNNNSNKDNFSSLNKDFSFLLKINEILIKVTKEEKKQFEDNSCYYCDKGFFFNIKDKQKIGFKIENILYNNSKKNDNVFCILFTFLIKENKNIEDNNQILLCISDSDNKEYLTIFIKRKKLYLRYFSKKVNEHELNDIIYNSYYSFFFLYDKNKIKIYLNNNDVLTKNEKEFKLPEKLKVCVGYSELSENPGFSFNGIICPILLFEINNNIKYDIIKKNLLKFKNNYYLIGEEYFNNKNSDKNKKNENNNDIIDNYENYYGLYDELEKEYYAKLLLKYISNIVLYVNPYVVIGTFKRKTKIYKDYNIYKSIEKDNKIIQYNYEFNISPSLEQGLLFPFKDNNIISFFKINNGINFIILEIELIFNYILLINDNNDYMELLGKESRDFYELM